MQPGIEFLEYESKLLLKRMLNAALTGAQDNEYASWTSVSYLDWVELRDSEGAIVPRHKYPTDFHEYLPNISSSNTSYAVSTIPVRKQNDDGSFSDGVRICLGDVWNSRIVGDMRERFLTGTATRIIDDEERESNIHGWILLTVEITKEDGKEKIAHLNFREDSDSNNPTTYLARWGWSKRTPNASSS